MGPSPGPLNEIVTATLVLEAPTEILSYIVFFLDTYGVTSFTTFALPSKNINKTWDTIFETFSCRLRGTLKN